MNAYLGVCGKSIAEDWRGDMQCLICGGGRSMQCVGGAYPEDLCEGCSLSCSSMVELEDNDGF